MSTRSAERWNDFLYFILLPRPNLFSPGIDQSHAGLLPNPGIDSILVRTKDSEMKDFPDVNTYQEHFNKPWNSGTGSYIVFEKLKLDLDS